MFKEKGFIISILVVVVVLIIGFIIFSSQKDNPQNPNSLTPAGDNTQTNSETPINPNPPPTVTQAPNVAVPNTDSTKLPPNVARPESVIPSGTAAFRTFVVRAEAGKFTPDTLIVNNRDVVRVKLSSIDKDYDFTLPDYGLVNYFVKKGQSLTIEFGASGSGKYTFYCITCGGPEKGPVGYLIVK